MKNNIKNYLKLNIKDYIIWGHFISVFRYQGRDQSKWAHKKSVFLKLVSKRLSLYRLQAQFTIFDLLGFSYKYPTQRECP